MKDPHQAIKNYEAILKFLDLVKERILIERKYTGRTTYDSASIAFEDRQEINLVLTMSSDKGYFRHKVFTPLDIPGLSRPHQDRIRYLKNKHGEDKD